MIYLVSANQSLFDSEYYEMISPQAALSMIESWERIQFDTETTGRDPHICRVLCAQFGNKKANTQVVVDTTSVDLRLYAKPLEEKLVIGHNLKFDIQFLFQYEIIPTNVWDTMIVEQFLHLGYDNKFFHYGLKDVAFRRLNITIDKSTRGEIIWRGLDDKVILYAAGDVMYLEDIMEQQKEECIKKQCLTGAIIENRFVPVMAYLEWCGIKLDVKKWQKKIDDNESKLKASKEKLDKWFINLCDKMDLTLKNKEYEDIQYIGYTPYNDEEYMQYLRDKKRLEKTGYILKKETPPSGMGSWVFKYVKPLKTPKEVVISLKNKYIKIDKQGDLFSGFNTEPQCLINWDSSKQVIEIVKAIGFDTAVVDKSTGEKKDTVIEKNLRKQKGIDDEFLDVYFKYKEASKECSTYGQNYIDAINPNTGRIHTTFWQLGAASGRMSCGSRNSNTDLAKLKGIAPSRCKYVQIGPFN